MRAAFPAWIAAASLALLAALCYVNALGNPFVLDDQDGVLQNTHIRQLTPLREVLTAPPQSVVAGRPVVGVSLALNYAWGELTPNGYHLVNLVVLWTTSLLVFGIVRRTLCLPSMSAEFGDIADGLALTIAAIWLVHPLQTELVNYVVQRSESMMGCFYLLTLYASIRLMTEPGRVLWLVVAVVASLFGMATKESMATAPLMVLLFDVVFVSRSLKTALRNRGALHGGLAAGWIVLAYLNVGGPRSRSAGYASGISPVTYLMNQGPIIVDYLKLSVWPHPLIADYGITKPIGWGEALPGLIVVSALGLLTLVALWKWPKAGFLGAWFFVTLAPASSIVPIATEVGAERRMYLPLIALVTLAACGAAWWLRRRGVRPVLKIAAVPVLLVVALAALTIRRNTDYADQTALWQQVIRDRPNGRAHYSLAMTLRDRGQRDAALAEFQKAIAEGHYEGYYAVGFVYDEMNRTPEAIEQYRTFIAHAGEDYRVPLAYVLLGRALARQQNYGEAEAAFRRALTMQPRNKEGLGGLADVVLAQERYAEAVEAYRAYFQVAPHEAAAFGNLGRALVGAGRDQEAAQAFGQSVAMSPNDLMGRMNYGLSLAAVGRLDDAIAEYRAGLQIAPNAATLLSSLGAALAAQGKGREAADAFQRALQIAPDNPVVRADIESAMRK